MSEGKRMTVVQAAIYANMTPQYIGYLCRSDKLKATLEPTFDGSETYRYMIEKEDMDTYLAKPRRGARPDGRNRFNLWMTAEELEWLDARSKEDGVELIYERAYSG